MADTLPVGGRLAKPSLLLGMAVFGAGLVLTLLDESVGLLLLGIGLMWFGAMLQSRERGEPVGLRKL